MDLIKILYDKIINKKPYTKKTIRYRSIKTKYGVNGLKQYVQNTKVKNKPSKKDFNDLKKAILSYVKGLNDDEILFLSSIIYNVSKERMDNKEL